MEYHYQVPWLAHSTRPGKHRSSQAGSGMVANRSVPLHSGADLRRLDIRARIADPMRRWWVRETLQRDAIAVWLIADVSSSLRYATTSNSSYALLKEFAAATAQSAVRSGDAFGMIAADKDIRDDLSQALTRRMGACEQVHDLLSHENALRTNVSAAALPQCAAHMSTKKSLVFLVSDFLFSSDLLDVTLNSLAHHHVVPVILPGDQLLDDVPTHGLMRFHDLEDGRSRTLWLRPSLHQKLRLAVRAHEESMSQQFIKHGVSPLRLHAPFNPDQVTEYFFDSQQ